jgi:hypothetical protein
MTSNLMKKFFVILFISSFYFNFAFTNELKLTTDPNAVCNNGEQATFTIKKGKSNKWAVILPGGGIARNSEEYRSRPEGMKAPELKPHYFGQGIEKDLEDRNYNLVFIPYCSSDLYQSDHINLIDGNEVPFRGRVIVEDVIEKIDKKLMNADEVMFLGYSAGAIGIGFHAKTIGKYKNVRVLVDSFWVDDETKKFYQNFEKNNDRSFTYKSSMEACDNSWVNCYPSRDNFEKNSIKDVFFIWNIGDKYANGVKDKLALKKAIKKDLEFYNAGFSIEADKRKISGFEDWGHVLAWDNKTYTKNYFDMSLQEAVNNWIDKKGNAVVVDYLLSEEKKAEINKKSKLFDGEYKFKLYRSSEDGKNKKIGNGKLELKNGQLTFFIKSSKLKTGPKDHYETAKININPNGELNGSIKLDILSGKDRSEVYYFKGMLNDKIWGVSPDESFFKVYIEIKK